MKNCLTLRMILFLLKDVYWLLRNKTLQYANKDYIHHDRIDGITHASDAADFVKFTLYWKSFLLSSLSFIHSYSRRFCRTLAVVCRVALHCYHATQNRHLSLWHCTFLSDIGQHRYHKSN